MNKWKNFSDDELTVLHKQLVISEESIGRLAYYNDEYRMVLSDLIIEVNNEIYNRFVDKYKHLWGGFEK